MTPIAIIYNSRAGKHAGGNIAERLSVILGDRKIPHHVFGDQWPVEYSGFSAVWVVGGDGTLNYFINHIKGHLPPMAVFKGGTGNDFSSLLYGDISNEDILEKVLCSSAKQVDAGVCNGQYFLNMCGLGFDGEVLKHMRAIRWMGAFWGYYSAIIKSIVTFREPNYDVAINDGPTIRKQMLLVMVCNASHTGGGFHVAPGARIDDGELDLVTADQLGVFKRLRALPLVRKGKHLALPFVHHDHVSKVEIVPDREVYAQVDGELIRARRFSISIAPGKFRFLY